MRVPNWIGDIVMATPVLRAVRAHWPEAQITAAGPPHAAAILGGSSRVDAVVPLPMRGPGGGPGALPRRLGTAWKAGRCLREGRFDLGLVLTNSFSSALALRLAGVPRRVGYGGGGRGPLLTRRLVARREGGRHRSPEPMVESYLRLLDLLGVARAGHRYELFVTDDDEQRASTWLREAGWDDGAPLVGIHPGASFGPSKLWLPEHFASVANTLVARYGARVIVFCGPREADLARSIAERAGSSVLAAADAPIALSTLKAMVRRLSLLISIDTGPRHFGAAFDVPTVVLMGSTDPRFTNTNLHSSAVVRTAPACSPCQRKHCPRVGAEHMLCMTTLTPAMVLAAAEGLLAGRVARNEGS